MSENTTRLYIKHPSQEINKIIHSIFKTINDEPKPNYDEVEKDLLACALEISPSKGNEAYSRFIKKINDAFVKPSDDLVAEAKGTVAGYNVFRFVHGNSGFETIKLILEFLFELSPEIDARACLSRLLKYCQRVRKITIVRVLYPLPSPKKSLVARSGRSIFLAAGKQTSISAAC